MLPPASTILSWDDSSVIIQVIIVSCRHGGDTRYTTEVLAVGAKTPEEAIETAKRK
ncbi:hypothetical protein [Salinicoccus roseus]|uniref:hypothetical protein n=1 Tax=Salinicoccus roseus TaxID=45670 RepID=UPI001EF663A1|nr:hypothetical protein [Salinicoccus roseus]MCG7333635.1 hypothetical protein [Salinicoccus roseus]